jgi:hypothetical protein
MKNNEERKAKGQSQIRQERRVGGKKWGYDLYLRQPDGNRKRFRDFSFGTRPEAEQALAKLRLAGNKERYGITRAPQETHTTVKTATAPYIEEQEQEDNQSD